MAGKPGTVFCKKFQYSSGYWNLKIFLQLYWRINFCIFVYLYCWNLTWLFSSIDTEENPVLSPSLPNVPGCHASTNKSVILLLKIVHVYLWYQVRIIFVKCVNVCIFNIFCQVQQTQFYLNANQIIVFIWMSF